MPGGHPVRAATALQAWDVGKSKCRFVMKRIQVETSPDTKVCPRPTGPSL